jgi:hypothetical protein
MITLNINGYDVFLDNDFYEKISHKRLSVSKNKNVFYLRSGKQYIHRLVINAQKGQIVDHINGNGLDNRLENLRIATRQMNKANTTRGRSSKYIGVSFSPKRSKKFRVQVSNNGKKIHIGSFDTEIDAAKAYDNYAKNRYGENAILNFEYPPNTPSR